MALTKESLNPNTFINSAIQNCPYFKPVSKNVKGFLSKYEATSTYFVATSTFFDLNRKVAKDAKDIDDSA